MKLITKIQSGLCFVLSQVFDYSMAQIEFSHNQPTLQGPIVVFLNPGPRVGYPATPLTYTFYYVQYYKKL